MEAVEAPPRKKRSPRRDSESTPSYALPTFRSFQLCTLTNTIPKGTDWLFEMKFDGYRAQIAISGSEVVVYTRNGHDWTQQFKVIVPPLKTLTKGSVLLDGEIVAIDKAGRTNFSMLKTGIGTGIPLKFYAFDIFERDGQELTGLPLIERKAILEALIGERDPSDSLQYSHHVVANGKQVFEAMCAGGHEGVIAKRADGRYIGDRTTSWLKIKCSKRQEFVIGGWRPSDNGLGMASLILGTYEGGKFIYRGRVGTGFSDAMRDKILKQMEARRIEKSAFATVPRDIARKARWVRPELVAEVAYAEITPDGSVRHASFQGMRTDKKASHVVLETPVDDAGPALDPAMGSEIADAVGVKLSHPDKVMYPHTPITKAHLAAYYAAVADRMLPHIKDRPLSLVRDTDNDLQKTFFQKHQGPTLMKPIRRDIQMIFQDPYASLDPRMRVGDLVAEPLKIHGLAKGAEPSDRVEYLFGRVGLPADAASRYPHEFSGGQRQRICIARALSLSPKIIVADESVSALDVSVQAQVLDLLQDIQNETGIALLFISHDMAVVEQISHRVAVMYQGRFVAIGTRAQVFENPRHSYTQRLMAAVPVPDPTRIRPAIMPFDGEVKSTVRPMGYVPAPVVYHDIGDGHLVLA